MLLGYARTSLNNQNIESQTVFLKQFGCQQIFSEITAEVSDKKKLRELIEIAKEGDALVVSELVNLGVGLLGLFKIIEELQVRNIQFISIAEGIDTSAPEGDFFLKIVSAFAKMEKELKRESINAGIAKSKDKGIIGGRPARMDQAMIRKALSLLKSGKKPAEVMSELDVKKSTFYATIDVKNLSTKDK